MSGSSKLAINRPRKRSCGIAYCVVSNIRRLATLFEKPPVRARTSAILFAPYSPVPLVSLNFTSTSSMSDKPFLLINYGNKAHATLLPDTYKIPILSKLAHPIPQCVVPLKADIPPVPSQSAPNQPIPALCSPPSIIFLAPHRCDVPPLVWYIDPVSLLAHLIYHTPYQPENRV
jgi:hypothetical protein